MNPIGAIAPALLSLAQPLAAAECSATSGRERVTLVELFTSEGCNSCPPADRWLSSLIRAKSSGTVIPLAYHVDYWDSLGWRDRFAKPAFTARQEARQRAGRWSFLYTPQVVLNGADFREWRGTTDPAHLARPAPARAEISLRTESRSPGAITAHVEVRVPEVSGPGREGTVLHLALVENGLVSEVSAGENAGRRLEHSAVVRDWVGPLALDGQGRISAAHEFRRNDIDTRQASLVAIVETANRLELLQALRLDICP